MPPAGTTARAGTALVHPPTTPIPHAWPGVGYNVVCGCGRAGTTARANTLTQIVLNLSSLYTLFYSVNYNSGSKSYFSMKSTITAATLQSKKDIGRDCNTINH